MTDLPAWIKPQTMWFMGVDKHPGWALAVRGKDPGSRLVWRLVGVAWLR